MEIISHEINDDNISLTVTENAVGLVLSHGDQKFTEVYNKTSINDNNILITKEELGLDNLSNRYFKIELSGVSGTVEASTGIYKLDIDNDRETPLYDAAVLKQELDNLNYYDGVIFSLTEKKAFREANDLFFDYKQFLEKKLNGNNFIKIISG